MSDPRAEVLATFDEKLKIYMIFYVAFIMSATVVGLLAIPLWILVGPWWASRYFPTIEARLGERALVYRHGVWFRQEMSIPLDKIQDVSLHHGPVLDALGIATLKVETAGGGQHGSGATLIGVRDAGAFRAAILARRDALAGGPPSGVTPTEALLGEIRDSLRRIEGLLSDKAGSS